MKKLIVLFIIVIIKLNTMGSFASDSVFYDNFYSDNLLISNQIQNTQTASGSATPEMRKFPWSTSKYKRLQDLNDFSLYILGPVASVMVVSSVVAFAASKNRKRPKMITGSLCIASTGIWLLGPIFILAHSIECSQYENDKTKGSNIPININVGYNYMNINNDFLLKVVYNF